MVSRRSSWTLDNFRLKVRMLTIRRSRQKERRQDYGLAFVSTATIDTVPLTTTSFSRAVSTFSVVGAGFGVGEVEPDRGVATPTRTSPGFVVPSEPLRLVLVIIAVPHIAVNEVRLVEHLQSIVPRYDTNMGPAADCCHTSYELGPS